MTEPHLDHELLDDPVEDVAVVVAVPRVHAEALHRLGAFLREQLLFGVRLPLPVLPLLVVAHLEAPEWGKQNRRNNKIIK